jgi:hypothetical protein
MLKQDLEVFASPTGTWWLYDSDHNLLGSGETLDQAKAKARATMKKDSVRVDVPFLTRDLKPGVATGFHAGTRKVLARIDGEARQLEGWSGAGYLRADMPAAERERLLALDEQAKQLEREIKGIEKSYGLDLRKAVEEAIEEAREPGEDA